MSNSKEDDIVISKSDLFKFCCQAVIYSNSIVTSGSERTDAENVANDIFIRIARADSRDEELVKVKYWSQQTNESGSWLHTEKIKLSTARDLINSRVYHRAEIVKL